ncbi:MAG: hypothetical protein JW804_01775 [Sedimentisphaerales bacterium]|nr:hypothetical protein [Sedimentisphaerales bacterium]
MPYNIRIVSSYPPRKCGIGTFSRHLANALANFTGEIGYVRVAAIDKEGLSYNIPVDLVIHQYEKKSWQKASKDIIARAHESEGPTIILLQHEYGLDPDENGNDAQGYNFVEMAKALRAAGLVTMAYLHTVLESPDDHQKRVLQSLADNIDALLVPTRSAINILESPTYGISTLKIKHIDHGIRMQNPSQYDRLYIKRQYHLENKFLATTLGLFSPSKGIEYGIRAFGKFLNESCTAEQRKRIIYLIAGGYHPEFVKTESGKPYEEFKARIYKALNESNVTWHEIKELDGPESVDKEVVILNSFLDESTLIKLYSATNVMLLPYLNMEQISSGILADTVGSGRVAISTKFRYAVELLNPESQYSKGLYIGAHSRGVLVDPVEDSIEQIAQALDYIVFNSERRLAMEKRVHRRGYQMKWDNTAWAIIQYAHFVKEQQDIVTGRGIEFDHQKESIYEKINRSLLSVQIILDKTEQG